MNWRRLFSRTAKTQDDSETIDMVIKLSTSEALFNRAAIDRETLNIYQRMIAAPSEIKDQTEAMRESGRLFAQLVGALARQVGKPTPGTPQATLSFLNEELNGFDTVEARERREQALRNEFVRILKEGGKEADSKPVHDEEPQSTLADPARTISSNPLIAPLEKALGVTKAEADTVWYESSYPASEAYRTACDAARDDLEARFLKVFAQIDDKAVETDYLKRSIADERERSRSENDRYFISLFGPSVDSFGETVTVVTIRALAEKVLDEAARIQLSHLHLNIGTITRFLATVRDVLAEPLAKNLSADGWWETDLVEALRSYNMFEGLFPLMVRKKVRFGSSSWVELAEAAFPKPATRTPLFTDYNIVHWTKRAEDKVKESPVKRLARAFSIAALHKLPDTFDGRESEVQEARDFLRRYPAWFLNELLGAEAGTAISAWLASAARYGAKPKSELEVLEERIEKLEKTIGISSDDDTDVLPLANRLLDGLAKEEEAVSIAQSEARDFCEKYFEILWDKGSDKGISGGLALSPEDVEFEIWNYEKWKQLQILRRVDRLLRLVGR